MKITNKMLDLISELTKNAKKSDRDIAKKLNISQPTVTRMRKKLEDKKLIVEYTAILNLARLGFELVAFVFFKTKKIGGKKVKNAAHDIINQHKKIVYAGMGNGLSGQDTLIVSVHKDFTDYANFIEEIKRKWRDNITDVESFLVSIRSFSPKPFSFKDLGNLIGNIESQELKK